MGLSASWAASGLTAGNGLIKLGLGLLHSLRPPKGLGKFAMDTFKGALPEAVQRFKLETKPLILGGTNWAVAVDPLDTCGTSRLSFMRFSVGWFLQTRGHRP
ncbi:MAG: hypothetical protein R2857_12525 [Vampirovibrionales bacterium]